MARLEKNKKEFMERTTSLKQRVGHMEERIGDTEDRTAQLELSAAFLLQQTAKLSVKCNDLESRMRRIERAHRSLVAKPKDSAAPSQAIVRFLDYKVKEYIIRQYIRGTDHLL